MKENVKIAKELIKLAKNLIAVPVEQEEQQDVKLKDMIKQINSKKSELSSGSQKNKQCGTLGVAQPKLKQLTVQDLITALYQIANKI